ncbi:hypothetical protein [Thiocapsa bogorovii]|uniref:hypothetical protein n=1 Tax=Thiocapsa bogorovii TaxID=521689 RepID=UPI001E513E7B|nr:hypothetical protein [Thiocapsa bogorovii]UHD18334.1 hypothetical protein LT988_10000 [Thiocapsa bogorovii]
MLSQPSEHERILSLDDGPPADGKTPGPATAAVPSVTHETFRSDAKSVGMARMTGRVERRRGHGISDPIPVEETGLVTRPEVVDIGELLDADALSAESADARESMPIQIGGIIDANDTDVWYLSETSVEVIEIGARLDADFPWPEHTQEREPVDIGPPIEPEGLGTLF